MAEVFKIFSDKIEAKMASILERAKRDENDSLKAAIERLQHNRIETERFGENKSFYIGTNLARGRFDDTLARMKKFYERDEKIEASFAKHFKMMGDNSGVRNVNNKGVSDETWLYQTGMADSGVSDDFSYLRDKEKEQKDFFAKIEAARVKRIIDTQKEYQEKIKRTRLAESRGSIRNRKERLMLMREFPTFFKNSKMSTKDMRDIARTLRTIRKTPILKNMVFNPFASAAAFVGLQKAAFNISDAANKEVTDWQNQALMTGGLSKELEGAGYLAGLKGPGEMMEVLGKFQAKYGPAATDVLKGFGSTIAAAPAEQRMIVASRLGLDTKTSALAMALSNPEMFQSDQRITQAARNKLEAVKTMGYSSGSSFSDTVGSLWLSMFAGAQARDARDFEYVNKDVNENYSEMMNRLVYVLDDVKKTAEADDQFAAGKFETYTDTTDNSKKEVNVQMNLGGVTVQPGGDARGFVDELMAISTNGISQSRAVVDAFDTKRKK